MPTRSENWQNWLKCHYINMNLLHCFTSSNHHLFISEMKWNHLNFFKIYSTLVYLNNRSVCLLLLALKVSAHFTARNGLEELNGTVWHVPCRICSEYRPKVIQRGLTNRLLCIRRCTLLSDFITRISCICKWLSVSLCFINIHSIALHPLGLRMAPKVSRHIRCWHSFMFRQLHRELSLNSKGILSVMGKLDLRIIFSFKKLLFSCAELQTALSFVYSHKLKSV